MYLVFTCSLSLNFNYKLYKSFVTSTLLYGCETWTWFADTEKRIQVFETKCLRKLPRISYLELKTNDRVRSKINSLVGPKESLLATVKRRKLAWSSMSHATTASPKPSFRAPWTVGDAVVSRVNTG